MMLSKKTSLLFLTACVILTSQSFADEGRYVMDQDSSRIEFSFRSTLHKVEGEALMFEGEFKADAVDQDQLTDGWVEVQTMSLDTHHEKRDAHMFEMFETEVYPDIRFVISEVKKSETTMQANGLVILKGDLRIKDQTRTLEFPARLLRSSDGLHLSGEVDLSLKDFQLKPPSVAMVIRVFDTIHIQFDALLKEIS